MWFVSVFFFVIGVFLLFFGRIVDIYGVYWVFSIGMVWFLVWFFIFGFSMNYIMFIVIRVLGGFGLVVFLLMGIMLLGKLYCLGLRKNLVFVFYSVFVFIGFFLGIIMGGLMIEYFSWRWYFYIGFIILFIFLVVVFVIILKDME